LKILDARNDLYMLMIIHDGEQPSLLVFDWEIGLIQTKVIKFYLFFIINFVLCYFIRFLLAGDF